jgi:hypothetical protein
MAGLGGEMGGEKNTLFRSLTLWPVAVFAARWVPEKFYASIHDTI